jgi:chromosome segregation ATPase
MTSFAAASPSPLSGLVDETRVGSAGGQTLTGVAGIVLAILLIVGQISLATTKGIAEHLHSSVQHMADGNEAMQSILVKSAPSAQMERDLNDQQQVLLGMRDTMVQTNQRLAEINATSTGIGKTTDAMIATSNGLAQHVKSVDAETAKINRQLGSMPASTAETKVSLDSINGDMHDLNVELKSITDKLLTYGLPRAKGARRAP